MTQRPFPSDSLSGNQVGEGPIYVFRVAFLMGNRSSQGVKRVEKLLQAVPYVMEAVEGKCASQDSGVVVSQFLLGGFETETLLFDQERHHPQFLHIRRGVEADSCPVAARGYDGEPAFPETQSGGGEANHFGHL